MPCELTKDQYLGCWCPGSYVARSSAAMVLTMQDKQVLVFHKEEFQQPAPSRCWNIVENANISFTFPKNKFSKQGVNASLNGLVPNRWWDIIKIWVSNLDWTASWRVDKISSLKYQPAPWCSQQSSISACLTKHNTRVSGKVFKS